MTTTFTIEDTLDTLREAEGRYGSEAINQLEHALQAAEHALAYRADTEVVLAALLHDIGRLGAVARHYRGQPHEVAGAAFCQEHLGERTAFLVGQHVPAKRYLVVVDSGYAEGLSPASVRSLEKQGGPMTPAEVTEFEAHPWAQEAALLRRWDDAAKVPGAPTHDLGYFEPLLRQAWRSDS